MSSLLKELYSSTAVYIDLKHEEGHLNILETAFLNLNEREAVFCDLINTTYNDIPGIEKYKIKFCGFKGLV